MRYGSENVLSLGLGLSIHNKKFAQIFDSVSRPPQQSTVKNITGNVGKLRVRSLTGPPRLGDPWEIGRRNQQKYGGIVSIKGI